MESESNHEDFSMDEATLRQETCHNHTSQIIIPEEMKSFISDLESKVGHFNTLNRAVNDIMKFAAQKTKKHRIIDIHRNSTAKIDYSKGVLGVSPRSNSIAEDTEGPKEEVIEESKSDMHMKTGSQHSDDEISYPPEGSSVSFNLCSEQDQAFFHDCTSKLQNLQFVEFQVGNEIPEGFFEFINEYFPDKVQNCKWSSIISPEFLSIDSFLDAILEVSANVKEALEISNFNMDQAQFNRLIDQCKAEKELIFTSCLFKIRDMQNLFKNSERTEKIDLSFNDNHYVDESIESAEDPPILPFSNILEAYKDPEDS